MFNIKKSLLCISAISCMSLYAADIAVDSDITIGSTPSVPTETGYNYWLDGKTYVFNNNSGKYWKANEQVTIDKDYILKLITDYTDCYCYFVLECFNTFTNNGNVRIDNHGTLGLNNYTSTNNGTIDIINGKIALYSGAILNNKGTITSTGSSRIYITSSSTLNNKGTIDISNITDLSRWYNDGTFTLKGGSTFILPKSITNKINTYRWKKPITLNGTKDKPVNIVIPKDCEYITNINNKKELFSTIKEETGFTFNGNKHNVKFSRQTSLDNECEYVDEC